MKKPHGLYRIGNAASMPILYVAPVGRVRLHGWSVRLAFGEEHYAYVRANDRPETAWLWLPFKAGRDEALYRGMA